MDYLALTKEHGTPLYVYDFDIMKKKYDDLKNAFHARKSLICYAVKANSNLSVLKHLAMQGSGCDCVSIGEVKRALMAGVLPYKIIFSGVGKKDSEIEEALRLDILMINIESLAEYERVELIAKKLEKVARISVRINPNIDPKTHPYISTGLHENKFGVDIKTAKEIYIKAKNSPFIEPVGIHLHIGSQITELDPFKEAVAIVADLVFSLQALDIELKFFDVGGGIGIQYEDEKTIEPYEYAQGILEAMRGLDMTIVCEPGRYLVGESGVFLTKVLYEKQNEGKEFVIVDGAMNDLIRPSLYGAYHEIELLGGKGDARCVDIVGPICESGDFFAKNVQLQKSNHNDILLIKSAGAYCFTMSSNYNTRGRVAEVALQGGKSKLIRSRESFEDMVALEQQWL